MNTEKKLYQWDTGQKLTGCTGLYVDFPIGNEVYRVETADGTCIIPDELLQTSGGHKVYECMTNNTIRSFAFSVTPRPKPPEYVFAPTERLTFEGLVQKVDDAVADMIRRAESGEFDGYTPVKGTDYFAASEIQQIQNEVSSGAIGEFKTVVDTETETFNNNAETKLTAYNQNDSQKRTAYNTNAEAKMNAYNTNANNRVAEFDSHTGQIQTDISELKSDINNLYIIANPIMEQGGLLASNGNPLESNARIRTTYFVKNVRLSATNGYEFLVCKYSDNFTYVGCWNGTGYGMISDEAQYVRDFELDNNNYKIVLKKTDETNLSPTDNENLKLLIATDKTLKIENKIADAKICGDKFNNFGKVLTGKTDDVIDSEINGAGDLIIGAINGSGSDVSDSDSFRTDFVKINYGNTVYSNIELIDHTVSYYHYVAFYNSNKEFISRTGGSGQKTIVANVPNNAEYVRASYTYIGLSNYVLSNFKIYANNSKIGSPKDKWYILGDSISAGYYSMLTADVPSGQTPAVSYEDGTCSLWDSSLEHNYWGYINKWYLNRILVGKAYPAQGYLHVASNSQNGISVVKNNDFSDAGLITVAWGFNDWHYNMPRGDHNLIDTNEPIATTETDSSTITTINQAIWYCLGVLIDKAPNAKIIVQTPMNGWRYGGDFSTKWGIEYAFSNSGNLKDIHDDIIYWCDYYGLEYIDLTYNNSIVNYVNIKDTLIDGSHPSDEAHKQLARSVWTKIGY